MPLSRIRGPCLPQWEASDLMFSAWIDKSSLGFKPLTCKAPQTYKMTSFTFQPGWKKKNVILTLSGESCLKFRPSFIWGLIRPLWDFAASRRLALFVHKGVIREILRFTASRLLPWQQATDVTAKGWLSSSCTAFGIPESSSFLPRRPRAPFPQVYTSPSVEKQQRNKTARC